MYAVLTGPIWNILLHGLPPAETRRLGERIGALQGIQTGDGSDSMASHRGCATHGAFVTLGRKEGNTVPEVSWLRTLIKCTLLIMILWGDEMEIFWFLSLVIVNSDIMIHC